METTLTVTAAESVGPDTVALTFQSPETFDAQPGQFVKLSATVDGEGYARFYTLSSPNVTDTFEVTVGVSEDGGPFSRHLAQLEPGDELEVDGPYGSDHYEGEARVVVLAGGPGVGPAVGIAERALDDGNEAAVVYRYDGDAPAHEARLDALREQGADVTVVGPDGDLTDAVADALTGDDGEQTFVYGFAPFVDEALEAVREAGGADETAKVENFG
ncbi:FAD-dependent oxidoreductase [Halobium salinum]|uniref:FAD-dependent oxidoreductase n=1 Tax=Halobium salinum TaxID=1364940 RepID=A0ABD5PDW1_9EURY|nr:FAD-dependent oxidoreductase [Halobium salinum]